MIAKQYLNFIIALFILIAAFGCKETEKAKNTIKTKQTSYKIEGLEFKEIPDSTYVVNTNNANSILFNKSVNNSITIISARTFDEKRFTDDDEFRLFAETYMKNQMGQYEMKSLHFDIKGLKNTTCLKFDGTFRDSTNQDKTREYISHDGYLCVIPNNESKIAEIKVTRYSSERGMPKDVIYEFQAFVEQLKFIQN